MSYYRNLSCAIFILAFLIVGELGLHSLRALLKGEAQVVANQASAETNDNQASPNRSHFHSTAGRSWKVSIKTLI